jgi:hypothetical protein
MKFSGSGKKSNGKSDRKSLVTCNTNRCDQEKMATK